MRYRPDGSIQSALTPTADNVGRESDHALYRCMVTKVVYVDDANNITTSASNPRVLYDVVVLGGFASGQVISNCRLSSDLGGNTAYWERVLKASDKDISAKGMADADGDVVYVQFIQGHTGFPVIIGLDNGLKNSEIGAKKADGPRSVRKYNGVKEEINKDGELIITRSGGTANAEKGGFKPAAAVESTIKLGKDEKITISTKSGPTTTVDGKADKVVVSTKAGAKATLDGKADKIELATTAGAKATLDGKADKVTITTSAAAEIEIDGQGGKITLKKGSTIIELDSNSGKISLKGDFVDLGSSVSDFAVLFTELLTAFNTHTHPFVDLTPVPVPSVTMPPTAPMLQTVGSLTVKVQP